MDGTTKGNAVFKFESKSCLISSKAERSSCWIISLIGKLPLIVLRVLHSSYERTSLYSVHVYFLLTTAGIIRL